MDTETITFRVTEEMLALRKQIQERGVDGRRMSTVQREDPESWGMVLHFMRLAERLHWQHLSTRKNGGKVEINGVDDEDLSHLIGKLAKLKRVYRHKVHVEIRGKTRSLGIDYVNVPGYANSSMYEFLLRLPLSEHYVFETVSNEALRLDATSPS